MVSTPQMIVYSLKVMEFLKLINFLVLHMSFRIQYNKYLLERAPRVWNSVELLSFQTFTLRGATESLVQRRMRLLRRLRALNKESYQKALEALKLNVHHLDPFDFGDSSEADVRKKKVKAECYQVTPYLSINLKLSTQQRLARLARFKRDLAAKREEFYDKKEKDLSELVEKVSSLGLEKPDAEAKLRDLFKLAMEERQVEALSPTQVDKLQWYAKERVLRRHVINSILEREAQQLRVRRKQLYIFIQSNNEFCIIS